jgi:hypothetical protein
MALTKEAREYFAKEGRKGGKAYAENSTAAERKARAKKAAQARWAKAKKGKEPATADAASARPPVTLKAKVRKAAQSAKSGK